MNQKYVVIPPGMVKAVMPVAQVCGLKQDYQVSALLIEAFDWLRKHPQIPTTEWLAVELDNSKHIMNTDVMVARIIAQWQREWFMVEDAPEPKADDFGNVFMFHATVERPARESDNPSEREKQFGIHETVTCVKAEEYNRLLEAYRRVVPAERSPAAVFFNAMEAARAIKGDPTTP